jgi:tetratricopeptide (TPR) repeat protein
MMLDRDKITFWTRLGAIVLAVIFVGSFVIMGVGSNVNLNLLDLLGGSSGAQEDQQQTTSSQEQITQARQELEEDPENPKIIRRLAGLYIQNGQTDEAAEVLRRGREVAPEDPVIPLYLGQAYERDAQAQTDADARQTTYKQAGTPTPPPRSFNRRSPRRTSPRGRLTSRPETRDGRSNTGTITSSSSRTASKRTPLRSASQAYSRANRITLALRVPNKNSSE